MDKPVLSAIGVAIAMQTAAIGEEAQMPPLRPDQVTFLALYKELVETNTTLSAGSCTLAAERMAAHLKSPQRAAANVNCRIFPGETLEATKAALVAAIGDPGVNVTLVLPISPVAVPPPLDPKIIGPAEKLVTKYFPGVPFVPSMTTAATDGRYLEAIGIPVYGVPGGWGDPDGNGAHGLNERESVRSVFVGRDYLTDLVKLYADSD
jgi:acetylornithine deacetylase/succinyl-diaminopimelate desuccinylase-like protein